MDQQPFPFVAIHPGTDSVDRPHQFPKGMQRVQLLRFPELAEPENVDECAPPHRKRVQAGAVGRMRHALRPGTNVARSLQAARGD